jgi:hypothetical protein
VDVGSLRQATNAGVAAFNAQKLQVLVAAQLRPQLRLLLLVVLLIVVLLLLLPLPLITMLLLLLTGLVQWCKDHMDKHESEYPFSHPRTAIVKDILREAEAKSRCVPNPCCLRL